VKITTTPPGLTSPATPAEAPVTTPALLLAHAAKILAGTGIAVADAAAIAADPAIPVPPAAAPAAQAMRDGWSAAAAARAAS
jgi:hypothetical protein